ncbi:hypothetical protein AA313_de0207238 [Arthrobotrys entomopaga]|nr:hypothetical protein AA313_de0207238 [Arthrobotrys entomopaga]
MENLKFLRGRQEQEMKKMNEDQQGAIKVVRIWQTKVLQAEDELNASQKEYASLVEGRNQSAESVDTACKDLRTLVDKSLDLQAIAEILNRSIDALKELNEYIEKMTKFFVQVSSFVEVTMRDHLGNFKEQTEDIQRLTKSRTAAENETHKTVRVHSVCSTRLLIKHILFIERDCGGIRFGWPLYSRQGHCWHLYSGVRNVYHTRCQDDG